MDAQVFVPLVHVSESVCSTPFGDIDGCTKLPDAV